MPADVLDLNQGQPTMCGPVSQESWGPAGLPPERTHGQGWLLGSQCPGASRSIPLSPLGSLDLVHVPCCCLNNRDLSPC